MFWRFIKFIFKIVFVVAPLVFFYTIIIQIIIDEYF